MKKRKLLILIILILTITTGCSIEYNITINKDTIKEEIIVDDIITTTRSKEKILEHYNKWYPTYVNYMKTEEKIPLKNFNKKYQGIEYYNKSIKEINYIGKEPCKCIMVDSERRLFFIIILCFT